MNQLILASGSPRRRELLGLFGIPFAVHAADIDETMDPDKSPKDEVARVSRCKAAAIRREEGDAVIAADTIVVCQGKVLGKPHSRQQAIEVGMVNYLWPSLTILWIPLLIRTSPEKGSP